MRTPHSNSRQLMTKRTPLSVSFWTMEMGTYAWRHALSQLIIPQLWKENSSAAPQWPMSPLQVCVLTTLRKLTKCTKIKESSFFSLLQSWIVPRCTANINLIGTYLLTISRNQQGVRGDMKKKESKHIISWLRQDIRKTSCYNLLLCFFYSSHEFLESTLARK